MSIVEFKNVVKRFGDNVVLDGIDLSIEKGEVVVIVGPSGSGKSTLLRCINVLETIQDGDIVVNGLSVRGKGAQVRELRREAGMVFQQFNLFPSSLRWRMSCSAPSIRGAWPGPRRAKKRWHCWTRSGWPRGSTIILASCLAVSSNGWRLPVHWPSSPF